MEYQPEEKLRKIASFLNKRGTHHLIELQQISAGDPCGMAACGLLRSAMLGASSCAWLRSTVPASRVRFSERTTNENTSLRVRYFHW
jgi:hypothetical protein